MHRTRGGRRRRRRSPAPGPPARRRARRPSAWTLPLVSTAVTCTPRAEQPRPRPERVAAVVARPDEQHHPPAVDAAGVVAQLAHQLDSEARGGPLHQRALGQAGHRPLLGRPHGGDVEGLDHGSRSATTTAEAMPASWRQREVEAVDPELGGAGGDGAGDLEHRLAAVEPAHGGVGPDQAHGRAERLGGGLLGGEPGGERGGREVLLGLGEQPVAQRRDALELAGEPLDVDDVDAHPDDHPTALLTRP